MELSLAGPPLNTADRALLRALAIWPGPVDESTWSRFAPAWGDRLRDAWERGPSSSIDLVPRHALRSEHTRGVRADLARIDPSWWLRALREESPAVQRAVVAHLPEHRRGLLLSGLNLRPEDLVPDREPEPRALACVLALWAERLVGGAPARKNDSLTVRAVTDLVDWVERFRLAHLAGLAKLAYALDVLPDGVRDQVEPGRPRDRDRLADFRTGWEQVDPRLAAVASREVVAELRAGRRLYPRLALTTLARLLTIEEPHRVRWVLQHLPYPVAKVVRARMAARPTLPRELLAWESEILRVAWGRILDESKLSAIEEPPS